LRNGLLTADNLCALPFFDLGTNHFYWLCLTFNHAIKLQLASASLSGLSVIGSSNEFVVTVGTMYRYVTRMQGSLIDVSEVSQSWILPKSSPLLSRIDPLHYNVENTTENPVEPNFSRWEYSDDEETFDENAIEVVLKSGQTFACLREDAPFRFNPTSVKNFESLKKRISRHLGDTPLPQHMILLHEYNGGLVELQDISSISARMDLFVMSSKAIGASDIVSKSSSSPEERQRAVIDVSCTVQDFLHRKKKGSREPSSDSKALGGRQRLEERAALFGLQENPYIDNTGNCQFDAAADQLCRYAAFAGATKQSVRIRVIEWIERNAESDLGHRITLRQWIEQTEGPFDEYLKRMSKDQTWGDEITLTAIIEEFEVSIVLLSSMDGNNWFFTRYPRGRNASDELPILWMGHEVEIHYWSLLGQEDELEAHFNSVIAKEKARPKRAKKAKKEKAPARPNWQVVSEKLLMEALGLVSDKEQRKDLEEGLTAVKTDFKSLKQFLRKRGYGKSYHHKSIANLLKRFIGDHSKTIVQTSFSPPSSQSKALLRTFTRRGEDIYVDVILSTSPQKEVGNQRHLCQAKFILQTEDGDIAGTSFTLMRDNGSSRLVHLNNVRHVPTGSECAKFHEINPVPNVVSQCDSYLKLHAERCAYSGLGCNVKMEIALLTPEFDVLSRLLGILDDVELILYVSSELFGDEAQMEQLDAIILAFVETRSASRNMFLISSVPAGDPAFPSLSSRARHDVMEQFNFFNPTEATAFSETVEGYLNRSFTYCKKRFMD
jgi:hypothetical protein